MSPKAVVWLLAAVCVWCSEECVCFPNGSVAFSCGSMLPVHPPFKPSTSVPPATLSASSASYRPGGLVTVTLEVVGNSSTDFQGFLIQARSRSIDDVLWPVGTFTNIDTSVFTPLGCNRSQNSTVAQASGAKRKKVQLTWEAPNDGRYGDIYFSATIVQDYTTFWVQVTSSSLRRVSSAALFCPSPLLVFSLFLFVLEVVSVSYGDSGTFVSVRTAELHL